MTCAVRLVVNRNQTSHLFEANAMRTSSGHDESHTTALRQRRFEELVDAYSTDLYRFAVWLGNDPMQAEDLVQETFMRAWRFLDALEKQASAKAWLLTILRREHARCHGRAGPRVESLDDVDLDRWSPTPDDSRQASYGLIRSLLQALPSAYREPLALQVIGGYSAEEIGQIMGLRPQAVLTRLFRAREMLRERFRGQPAGLGEDVADVADAPLWNEVLPAFA